MGHCSDCNYGFKCCNNKKSNNYLIATGGNNTCSEYERIPEGLMRTEKPAELKNDVEGR